MAKKDKRVAKKAKAKKATGRAKRLSVRGVYACFKALEDANLLEAFLKECDQQKHTLAVEGKLYSLGQHHLNKRPAPPGHVMAAAGPSCPACPGPPHL
jgi:hypothetical protein